MLHLATAAKNCLHLWNEHVLHQTTTSVSRELFLTVMSLPDKYKQVVLLYHYQSMTMEEVADALRVSRPAVSRRLKKAYELLRAELEGGAEHELG